MDIKESLERLGLNPKNSVVIGSGILNALGIRESKDIDVVATEEAYRRLDSGTRFRKVENHGRIILADELFEIGTSWIALGKEWKFDDLSDVSTVIDDVRYITLQFLLDVKRSWLKEERVRQKDKDDVALIENRMKGKCP
jgi:hypothetical protein